LHRCSEILFALENHSLFVCFRVLGLVENSPQRLDLTSGWFLALESFASSSSSSKNFIATQVLKQNFRAAMCHVLHYSCNAQKLSLKDQRWWPSEACSVTGNVRYVRIQKGVRQTDKWTIMAIVAYSRHDQL